MPRDVNQRAFLTAQIAYGEAEAEPAPEQPQKHAASVELGQQGGLIGGPRRAAKLSPELRRD